MTNVKLLKQFSSPSGMTFDPGALGPLRLMYFRNLILMPISPTRLAVDFKTSWKNVISLCWKCLVSLYCASSNSYCFTLSCYFGIGNTYTTLRKHQEWGDHSPWVVHAPRSVVREELRWPGRGTRECQTRECQTRGVGSFLSEHLDQVTCSSPPKIDQNKEVPVHSSGCKQTANQLLRYCVTFATLLRALHYWTAL